MCLCPNDVLSYILLFIYADQEELHNVLELKMLIQMTKKNCWERTDSDAVSEKRKQSAELIFWRFPVVLQ